MILRMVHRPPESDRGNYWAGQSLIFLILISPSRNLKALRISKRNWRKSWRHFYMIDPTYPHPPSDKHTLDMTMYNILHIQYYGFLKTVQSEWVGTLFYIIFVYYGEAHRRWYRGLNGLVVLGDVFRFSAYWMKLICSLWGYLASVLVLVNAQQLFRYLLGGHSCGHTVHEFCSKVFESVSVTPEVGAWHETNKIINNIASFLIIYFFYYSQK